MSEHSERSEQSEHKEHSHPNYTKIYITLVILLCISVAGPHLGIFWLTMITAFGVALIKADLVVQNFMHLRWEKRFVKWMLVTALVLMGLFFAGVAPDVMHHEGHHWVNDAAIAATKRGIPPPHHEGEEAAAADSASEGESAAPAEAAATPAPAAFSAQNAFQTVCATCHGPSGEGNGPGAAALDPKPANFTDPAFWADKTDDVLIKAIREGGASVGKSAAMPAWGALYDQQQAEALLAYLKTLKK